MIRPRVRRWRLAFAGAAAALAAGAAWVTVVPVRFREPRLVEFPEGTRVRTIARMLKDAGLVRSAWAFYAAAKLSGRPLRAGEYGFESAALPGVLRALHEGRVYQHRVLVPEGEALDQIAAALARERLADPARFRTAASDAALLRKLGIKARSAEGYLYPDTYLFPKGMREDQIVAFMARRFRDRLPEDLPAKASARGLDLHQLVTLASIVEKEARVPDERPVIAGVFARRLKQGMPLQADPTVRYAVRAWDRKLTRADLKSASPYNTYRNAGLPPGPICSPGLASLKAAAAPADVAYLYFVTRNDGTFRHEFSKTLVEHNQAVQRSNRRQDRQTPASR